MAGAGWHTSAQLTVPDNIVLLPLPAYAPELNPVENIWAFIRANYLSHRVFENYQARRESMRRRLEQAYEATRYHRLHRYPRLGAGEHLGPLVLEIERH